MLGIYQNLFKPTDRKVEKMGIRENLLRVLENYLDARSEPIAGHPLADMIRTDFRDLIRWQLFPNDDLLLVKGSAGQGAWARGPWVAIFDRLVTESAQRGFYPVYLFAEDMSSVYLSLNQGMTEIRENYRAAPKTTLHARAENFRAMLGAAIQPFNATTLDLAPSAPGNDTSFYEAGNICAVRYSIDEMPSEEELISDLTRVLDLYRLLIHAGAADEQEKQDELEVFYEGGAPARVHLRIERNRRLSAKVKKLKGFKCEACEMTFLEKYGSLGADFIEAHHRIPFAQLASQAIPLDPTADFAVLCANCHRMAHRLEDPADIDALRAIVSAHAR